MAAARKALTLNERDPYALNDLGWTLVLAGFFDEAKSVLELAADLAPIDYELPQRNLIELEKRRLKVLQSEPDKEKPDASDQSTHRNHSP